MSDRTL